MIIADLFVKLGAGLPASMKGGWNLRVMNRMLNLSGIKKRKEMLTTNLGIPGDLAIQLPAGEAPASMFFGTPEEYVGEYHTLMLTWLLSRYCDATVDIGANWGFYTYFLANKGVSPIFWFEPNALLNRTIEDNVKHHAFKGITGSHFALSETNGELTFYINKQSDLESSIVEPGDLSNIEAITVPATRFDSWVRQTGLSDKKLMVKVDVENAEWQFINGSSGCTDSIEFLILEILGPARQAYLVDHLIQQWMMNAYYINGDQLEFVLHDDMRYVKGEYNWLFTKHTPDALRKLLDNSIFKVI
jgi:FkbM family methyltransferase